MILKRFVFNPFSENTYLLFDETKECVIIDPGCSEASEQHELTEFIRTEGLTVRYLLNTHGHVDHVLGNGFVSKHFGVETLAHNGDAFLMAHATKFARNYGFESDEVPPISHVLTHGELVNFGNSQLEVRHAPGHSPGSVVFYSAAQGFAIVGDVLFSGSIGRTDLPGGDYDELIQSITTQLLSLPDKTMVYSGHGAPTTISRERVSNPFLKN